MLLGVYAVGKALAGKQLLVVGANIMNRSVHYIFGDRYFCGMPFIFFE